MKNLFAWRHWSIRTRLLLAIFVPVLYLFASVVGYSYQARQQETDHELAERTRILTTALSESLEANVLARNISSINLSINALVQSDSSIYRIAVFDAQHRELTHVTSYLNIAAQAKFLEVPIKKQLIWVNLVSSAPSAPSMPNTSSTPAQPKTPEVGYVRVTMSPTMMQAKQQERFFIELGMAGLGLLVSLSMVLAMARGLTRPLKQAVQALREIRGGDYATWVAVDTGGELGDLQTSINSMAESLYQAKEELENKVAARTRDLEASRNEAVKADAEKRRLIQKVHSIVEQERKSIALEVHDELNASLIAARLDAQRISQLALGLEISPAQQEIATKAQAIGQITRNLYANGRSLVRRLRPEVLDMLGLPGAVEEMLKHYNDVAQGCHFTLEYAGDFAQLDSEVAISAYRIVQEALSNILKHAQASQAHLRLQIAQDGLQMEIVDDGVGLSGSASGDEMQGGIGLTGMCERVYAFAGEITIANRLPHGVRIAVRLPLHAMRVGGSA